MGYDLHITRRENWFDTGSDITREEFLLLINQDPDFTWPGENGENFADWKNPLTGTSEWVCWSDGQIESKNPNPELITKMIELAEALKARVQGDDGEFYPLEPSDTRDLSQKPNLTEAGSELIEHLYQRAKFRWWIRLLIGVMFFGFLAWQFTWGKWAALIYIPFPILSWWALERMRQNKP